MIHKKNSALFLAFFSAVSFAKVSAQDALPVLPKASNTVVYVSRILEGNVVAIDTTSNKVFTILKTGNTPGEIVEISALDRVYISDIFDGTITVINTTNHGVETVLDVGHPIATIDANQITQKVFALDFSNGTPGTHLHVMDANTNVETADFAIGSRLQNIEVNSTANQIYATDFVEGVIVVDTATNMRVTTIPLGGLPHRVALNFATNYLYVTQLENGRTTIIDTMMFAVVDILNVGDFPQWIELDIPRKKGFVTNEGDGTVSVIDLATDTVKRDTIPVGPSPLTLTVDEAAARAYVYNAGDGSISVLDTISETVIATIDIVFWDGFELGDTTAWSNTAP